MADLVIPVLSGLGGILATVLGFLGVRYAARQSARAAEGTTAASNRQVDIDEWKSIVAELRTDRAEDRRQLADLSGRLDRLEQALREKDNLLRSLMAYARTLLAWAHQVIPDVPPPTPPIEFVDELIYITER